MVESKTERNRDAFPSCPTHVRMSFEEREVLEYARLIISWGGRVIRLAHERQQQGPQFRCPLNPFPDYRRAVHRVAKLLPLAGSRRVYDAHRF